MPMGTIFTVSDPLGRPISLKTETYNKKIANIDGSNNHNEHGNSHPDMEVEDIRASVEAPHFITENHIIQKDGEKEIKTITDRRQAYYRFDIEKSSIFKTIVEFADNNSGDIVTSHRSNKASSIKVEGGIIYDATK